MANKTEDKEQDTLDESVELSSQEKLEGQVRCLREMNKILKGAIERHYVFTK